VAPPVLLVLQGMVGWRGAFMVAALLGILAAAVMVLQRDALGGPTARAWNQPPEETANGEGWKLLFSLPLLRNLAFFVMLAITAGGMQNYSVVALGALYGTPLSVANAALAAYLLMISIGVLLGGLLTSRTQRHDLVAVTGLIMVAITALAVGLVSLTAGLLIALMAIGGLFSGLMMPSRDMIVRSLAPPGSFGKVFGFVTTGFNLGGIVSPLLFGWLMDQGHPRAIFLLGAACSLLSIPTVLALGGRQDPDERRA
jgi:MFS family permease